METFFVYGLVFLFFLCTLLFVIAVLPTYTEPSPANKNASAAAELTLTDKKLVYGTLIVILIGLVIMAALSQRKSH